MYMYMAAGYCIPKTPTYTFVFPVWYIRIASFSSFGLPDRVAVYTVSYTVAALVMRTYLVANQKNLSPLQICS